MSRPTLAVVLPNYNHAQYLPEAIESILAQTRLPDEFLILDDASTDNSVDVIESYARQHSFIQLIRCEENGGVHAAHRRLFEMIQSDYVDPMAADDARYPRCFELAMQMAEQHPEAGTIFGQMVMADDESESTWGATAWSEPLYADPQRFLDEYLDREPPTQSLLAATIFRCEPFREIGWYCDKLGSWGDTFVANALGLKFGTCYVPEPFARWRIVKTGYSYRNLVDPRATLDIIHRAVYLMRSPEFREYFPPEYVNRWRRRYVWRTIKEYWRCDYTGEFPPGSSFWTRYRHRLPRTFEALSLFWHRTDLSSVES